MALNDSSKPRAGRTPSCSTHDDHRPMARATVASTSVASGPGTISSRAVGGRSRLALGGSSSVMVEKRAASVSRPVAAHGRDGGGDLLGGQRLERVERGTVSARGRWRP